MNMHCHGNMEHLIKISVITFAGLIIAVGKPTVKHQVPVVGQQNPIVPNSNTSEYSILASCSQQWTCS